LPRTRHNLDGPHPNLAGTRRGVAADALSHQRTPASPRSCREARASH